MQLQAYYFCGKTPIELLQTYGFKPVRILAPATVLSESRGEDLLGSESCFWCRSTASLAAEIAKVSSRDIFIGSTTCDQSRRAFELLYSIYPDRCFMINVPATRTENAFQLFYQEIKRLGLWLSSINETYPTDDDFSVTINMWQNIRKSLLAKRLSISTISYIQRATEILSGEVPAEILSEEQTNDGVPIIITGAPITSAHSDFITFIENNGGKIVSIATNTVDSFLELDINISSNPLQDIALAYFNSPPSIWERPNNRFYTWLGEKIATTHAKGLIWAAPTFCDLWNCEKERARRKLGIPILGFELTSSEINSPRSQTRIEAFLENLS